MPRKSDGLRKSDTSTARLIADDEAPHKSLPTLQPIAPQPIAPAPAPLAATKDKEKEAAGIKEPKDSIAIEDLNLPKSIITRLSKGVLPPNTQVQANAILALSKSATLFVNYLAKHANDNTTAANKKTIMPGDVFKALDDTEFGFMRAKLEAEFAKFHETNSAKRSNYRKKVAAAKKTGSGGSADLSMTDSTLVHDDSTMLSAGGAAADQPSASKKAKIIPRDGPSRMDVDHDEISDAETVPDEPHDEDEEEDEEDDEVDEEDEEEEEDQEDEGEDDEDLDEEQREAREQRRNYDEALDEEDEDEDL